MERWRTSACFQVKSYQSGKSTSLATKTCLVFLPGMLTLWISKKENVAPYCYLRSSDHRSPWPKSRGHVDKWLGWQGSVTVQLEAGRSIQGCKWNRRSMWITYALWGDSWLQQKNPTAICHKHWCQLFSLSASALITQYLHKFCIDMSK